MAISLINQTMLQHTDQHVHVSFSEPHTVLSSAVLNGGMVQAQHILNLKVPKQIDDPGCPEASLTRYCSDAGWQGTCVGMMTAASMDSFRFAKETVQGVEIAVLVTSGLSNARRAGDTADYPYITAAAEEAGTINIIVLTSAQLTPSAMVEVLMMVTEAKTVVLQEAGVSSPVSGKLATGTGTDSIAVVSGKGPEKVQYTGKHVLFGEVLARLLIRALRSAVDWELADSEVESAKQT